MGSKRGPSAPDPYATAQAQGQVNADTARLQANLNRGDTLTPFGNVTQRQINPRWVDEQMAQHAASNPDGFDVEGMRQYFERVNPHKDRWETRVELSPEQRNLYDQGVRLDTQFNDLALSQIPRVQTMLDTPLTTDGMADWRTSLPGAGEGVVSNYAPADGFSADRQRVEQAMFDRLNPQFERQREALEARLLSQGFQPGTEAYRAAADEANRSLNDARLAITAQGGAEQSRLLGEARNAGLFTNAAHGQIFGQRAQDATFGNQTRQAQLAERMQLRAQPINEIATLFELGPGMQMPQAVPMQPVGVNAPDLAGMINSNYQSKLQNQQANNQALASLLGSAARAGGSYFGGR
jgi:hypothetical protein